MGNQGLGFDPVAYEKWLRRNFKPPNFTEPLHPNPSTDGWNKYTCISCGKEFSVQFKLDETRAKCNHCHRDDRR